MGLEMDHIKMGECNRCGMCCTHCPHIRFTTPDQSYCVIYDSCPPACRDFPDTPGSLTHPSIADKCGYRFIQVEKILVGCATYDGKEYCFEEYLKAYEAIDYPMKEMMMVDTSEKPDFFMRWRDQLNLKRIEINEEPNRRIALGMEAVRKYFLQSDCDRWLNLEADVIVPPDILKVLLSFGKVDWTSHCYPLRAKEPDSHQINTAGFGCVLFSRKLIEQHGFSDAPAETTTDGWYWRKVEGRCSAVDIWGLLDIKHRG